MEIRKLEVFCRVVELKSFTRAADAVLLSQPTVSEHIRSLEEELGQKLIDRLGREAEPTPVGLLLYKYAVRMLRLHQDEPRVEKIWRRRGRNERVTDALHAMISTPYMQGDYVYGVDSHGELRCLDARSGERIWEDLTAVPKARWSTIHMVRNGDRTWLFNERGELIIAKLTTEGFNKISRAQLIAPTTE